MKLKLIVKRTARRGGSIGLGLRWLLPVPTIVGAASVALVAFDWDEPPARPM